MHVIFKFVTFCAMPPRKLLKTTKGDENMHSNTKLTSSRNIKGKHDPKESTDNTEPEIDPMVLIEEMLKESNEKILAALQQRQENLSQTLASIDTSSSSPPKNTKK